MLSQLIDFLVVFALGALIGSVEILSRYKDAPFKVALSAPGLVYTGLNALVALSALLIVRLFGWTFSDNPQNSTEIIRWTQVLVSGLAAMTLFRSSLFYFHLGDQDISVGPNAILQILLVAVDKEVDRLRGKERARIVEEAMDRISFPEAVLNLPTVAIALMQNLSREDQDEILRSVKALKSEEAKDMPERTKTMSLGLTIMNVVGEDILKAAIDVVNLGQVPLPLPVEKRPEPAGAAEAEAVTIPENEVELLREKLKEKLKATASENQPPPPPVG
jgi:hypothetical protein